MSLGRVSLDIVTAEDVTIVGDDEEKRLNNIHIMLQHIDPVKTIARKVVWASLATNIAANDSK